MELSASQLKERFNRQNPRLIEAIESIITRVSSIERETKPRALLVGGFVRDLILDLSPTDADIEVYGLEADQVEALLEEIFPAQVNLVGRSFGVFKIPLEDGFEIDVALPRRESKTGVGHKDFSVEGDSTLQPKEAAQRRDFTINAILFDPIKGELLDPWNGIKDLKERTLRVIDPNHFGEDPLRVYRAVQFAARFELTVEPSTLDLLKAMVARGELDHLPTERVTGEWRKLLLKAKKPSIGLELVRELGIVQRYFPELAATINVPQEPEWHPEGDVWVHTCMVVDRAAWIIRREGTFIKDEQLEIMLGALCHDFGKPSTTETALKQGVMRIRSLGHEAAGAAPTQTFMARFSFGADLNHAALMGAREHLKPGMIRLQAVKDGWSPSQYKNVVRKVLRRIHPMTWRVLLAIAEADYRGRTLPKADDPIYEDGAMFAKTAIDLESEGPLTQTLLRGEDLLTLGIKAGPSIGELINVIEKMRDEGSIQTRDEALAHIRQLLQKKNGS